MRKTQAALFFAGVWLALHGSVNAQLSQPSVLTCGGTVCPDYTSCRIVRHCTTNTGQCENVVKCVANADLPHDENTNPMEACPIGRVVVLNQTDISFSFLFCGAGFDQCPISTDCFPHTASSTSVCCGSDVNGVTPSPSASVTVAATTSAPSPITVTTHVVTSSAASTVSASNIAAGSGAASVTGATTPAVSSGAGASSGGISGSGTGSGISNQVTSRPASGSGNTGTASSNSANTGPASTGTGSGTSQTGTGNTLSGTGNTVTDTGVTGTGLTGTGTSSSGNNLGVDIGNSGTTGGSGGTTDFGNLGGLFTGLNGFFGNAGAGDNTQSGGSGAMSGDAGTGTGNGAGTGIGTGTGMGTNTGTATGMTNNGIGSGAGTGTGTTQGDVAQYKPGQCPARQRNDGLGCYPRCNSDFQCPGTAKCCPNACGVYVCRAPNKPGSCPRPNSYWNFFCWDTCYTDSHCPQTQKCCYDGSCNRCMYAIPSNNMNQYGQYPNQNQVNQFQNQNQVYPNQNQGYRNQNQNQLNQNQVNQNPQLSQGSAGSGVNGNSFGNQAMCPPYSGSVAGCRSSCNRDSTCSSSQKCCRVGSCSVCLNALPLPVCNGGCPYGYLCRYNTCNVYDRNCRHTPRCVVNNYNNNNQMMYVPLMYSIFS